MKQNNKKKNWFLGMFIFSGCCTIAFDYNFSENGLHWAWEGKEQVAFLLGIVTVIFGVLWNLEQRKEKVIKNKN